MLLSSNFAIYMGDRWRPSLLGSSRYIWYPMTWNTGVPRIEPADVWSVNLSTGTFTSATGATYEAESGVISGSAQILSDASFSGGRSVGWLGKPLSPPPSAPNSYLTYMQGNGGSLTINNVEGIGTQQWVSLYYANGRVHHPLSPPNLLLKENQVIQLGETRRSGESPLVKTGMRLEPTLIPQASTVVPRCS